ncbi:hypothetical protein NAI81_11995, partial [Francisella tularensis subsp. holarctica]|uniref:hypothetical protein n=1 Tax=Francisella tularensis TaxID=263 RepID=UPI002381B790
GMVENTSGRVINAVFPLAEMFGYSTNVRSISQGRASFSMEFKKYAELPNNIADEIINSSNS